MTAAHIALLPYFRPKDESQKPDPVYYSRNAASIFDMDPAKAKSGGSPVSPFQFFPTKPVRHSPSPSSSPESSHVTAVSYRDDPSAPIGLSLSPPCATSTHSDEDHNSLSADSEKATADVSSHPKQLPPLPAAKNLPKPALPGVIPPPRDSFPPFFAPYPASAAAGWWAPYAGAFPSHAPFPYSPAGQAAQQALGTQQAMHCLANAPPWFFFGPPPFVPRPYLPVLAPTMVSDAKMEVKTTTSPCTASHSPERNLPAKPVAKPREVLPRAQPVSSGFRPWKLANRSCGSNDTSVAPSSNGATSLCSASAAAAAVAAAAAAVEACASSRASVPLPVQPQHKDGQQLMKAEGNVSDTRTSAAQQIGGHAAAASAINTANTVNAVNSANAAGAMSHMPVPYHMFPAMPPMPNIPTTAADQAMAYACSMGQLPALSWNAAAAAGAAAAGGFGFIRPAGVVSAEAGAGVVGEKRRLGRADSAAAGSADVQGKRKKRQKHSREVVTGGGSSGAVDCGDMEGSMSPRTEDSGGLVEGGCDGNVKEKEKACSNCGTQTTPFWRKDRSGNGQHLCNACGLYLAKNDAPRPCVLWKKEALGSPDITTRPVAPKA